MAQFPPHRVYVEPFGGAASVLLHKARSFCEVYNDLDGEVVNLFRVLRSPSAGDLIRALQLTPFSRTEFLACYEPSQDPVERARRLVARSFMGHGSGAPFGRVTGFRANAHASGAHNTAREWSGYPDALAATVERLRGVVIESRPAIDVMAAADTPKTLHYVDPPYLPETRSPKARHGGCMYHAYAHEMSEDDHAELLAALLKLDGMVILSGYPSALYDDALGEWERIERGTFADGGRARTEVLWLNPQAQTHHGLLAGAR